MKRGARANFWIGRGWIRIRNWLKRFEAGQGFAQKVEIDAARRLPTVDTESQPAERATA
jgi:hypothetical protein